MDDKKPRIFMGYVAMWDVLVTSICIYIYTYSVLVYIYIYSVLV